MFVLVSLSKKKSPKTFTKYFFTEEALFTNLTALYQIVGNTDFFYIV